MALATVVGCAYGAGPAGAIPLVPGESTTSVPPVAATSTTISTATTSTTQVPGSTTFAPVTPSKGSPPTTGVPNVPTGGPPTSIPAPGAPPPPPIDVGPSVAAVNTDLAQLAAISSYPQAQANVSTAEAQQAAAWAGLAKSRIAATGVAAHRRDAAQQLAGAAARMASLALAAYTGEAYAAPGSPQASSATGTVATAGGVAPDVIADEQVLLDLVVQHTEKVFTSARGALRSATADSARAAGAVAAASAAVGGADQGVLDAKAALAAAARAATTSGAAAQQASATSAGAQLTSATSPSMSEATALADAPKILGPTVATAPELAAWFSSTGHQADTTVPIAQLAADYVAAGEATGVRADLAFAQSIVETGFFGFPSGGQLTAADNNFAGIGACDTCAHGWSFPDASTGVSAQEQLLEAYASPTKVQTPLIGPVGVGGCCPTWVALAGKWASSRRYGVEILSTYQEILDWVIPQRLLAAGLAAPGSVVPAPPGTEASGPAGPAAPSAPGIASKAPAPATPGG